MSRSLSRTKSSHIHATAALLIFSGGVACGDGDTTSNGGGAGGTTDRDADASRDGASIPDARTADRQSRGDDADHEARDAAGDGAVGSGTDAANDVTKAGFPDATGNDSGQPRDGGASTLPVDLGAAGNYVILAETGISTVPTSAVTGDMGISPAAATYITGFALVGTSTNVYSMSPEVTGKVYAADYAAPTPSNLTTAIADMQTAFTDAAGRPASVSNLGAGNIGGKTLASGVYKWGTGLLIPSDLTLNGSATDVWIFQVASTLTVSDATRVALTGGALAKNVFWQVSETVTLGTTSHLEGVILGKTGIALGTGASINGRMYAQTAVSINSSTVVQPAP